MKKSFLFTSVDSFSTTDGPGIRCVIFLAKCPLRCIYCHNPETFIPSEYHEMSFVKLKRMYKSMRTYLNNGGGLTFSGGEPLLWAKQILEFKKFMNDDIDICLETSGNVDNEYVDELVKNLNSICCDIKFITEEEYIKYTNGSLKKVIAFLKKVDNNPKLAENCVIREVVVPTINDNLEYLINLGNLVLTNFKNIKKIELLPFHDMCIEKYEQFNMKWKLKDVKSMDAEIIKTFNNKLNEQFEGKLIFN